MLGIRLAAGAVWVEAEAFRSRSEETVGTANWASLPRCRQTLCPRPVR